ncbi:hypothetical protein [Streptomyces sp. NPDC088725]|uniref:hypothetical protein n=1 Tax=Streptomyces sp. NPDC088725 TaxID=3365873 RepID=UPI003804EE59
MDLTISADFFQRLLDLESRIESQNVEWYVENFENKVIDYWAVERPGRLKRSPETGSPIREESTVSEFLDKTGVLDLFRNRDSVGLKSVQSAVINPWGFVGFQFGEPLLMDLQYYRPVMETVVVDGERLVVPSYYASSLPETTWRDGTTSCLYQNESTGRWQVGTDVNRWQGTFTGRDGVNSFEDLRRYDCQTAILRRSLRHSVNILNKYFGKNGQDLWTAGEDYPTPASLLGACHLCGPFGVVAYLESGQLRSDEAGTSISTYLKAFADVTIASHDVFAA